MIRPDSESQSTTASQKLPCSPRFSALLASHPNPMIMVKLFPNFISPLNWLEIGAGDLMADLEARVQLFGEVQRLKKATSNDSFDFELRFNDCLLLDDKKPEGWLRRKAMSRFIRPLEGIDWGVLSAATSPEDVAQQLDMKKLLSQTRVFPNSLVGSKLSKFSARTLRIDISV